MSSTKPLQENTRPGQPGPHVPMPGTPRKDQAGAAGEAALPPRWTRLATPLREAWRATRCRINRRLNRWEFRHRRTRLRSLPYNLIIDPTNCCNLRCPLCPTGQGIMESPGKISLENFQALYDPFRPVVRSVGLYNWGEPFLHPQILPMIRHVARDGVRMYLSSNLNITMSAEYAEEVVRSGLTDLTISMDGYSQEAYEKYRRRGNIERLKANLELLVQQKRKWNSPISIIVRFIPFAHNEHELEEVRQFSQRIGADQFAIAPAILDLARITDERPTESLEKNGQWLAKDPNGSRYESGNWRYQPQACKYLWNTVVMRWDGEIFPCCMLYRNEDGFGNVLKTPFREIWNNERYVTSRSLFSADRKPGNSPCVRCYANGGYRSENQ